MGKGHPFQTVAASKGPGPEASLMSSPNSNPQAAGGAIIRPMWLTLLRVAAGVVFVLWSLVLLAWLILHWGILPRIDTFLPQIEQRLSAAVGVPVRIGSIAVRSSGWVPALSLRQVVLHDAQGREALKLPAIEAALSARSVLAFDLRLEQLLVEGADLDVRRDVQGRLFIAGIEVGRKDEPGAASAGGGSAADWFFRQHEVVVRGARVRWHDESRDAPPLQLDDVQFVARNGLRAHDIRIDATPPPEWGSRFSLRGRFRQPFFGSAGDWKRWSGTVYADVPAVDVQQLRRYASLPFALDAGRGVLRAWLTLESGQARSLTLDASLADVALTLGAGAPPMRVVEAAGRVQAQRSADSLRLSAQDFGFVTPDGLRWPKASMELTLQQPQDLQRTGWSAQAATGGSFEAAQIDLGVVTKISARLPIGQALQAMLDEAGAEGRAQRVKASWRGPLDQPISYRVQARLEGFAIAARAPPAAAGATMAAASAAPPTRTAAATASAPGAAASTPSAASPAPPARPGWRNATVDLDASDQGGRATVRIQRGELDLPGILADAVVPVDDLSASLQWRIGASAATATATARPRLTEWRADGVRFVNADASAELQAAWTAAADGRGPGTLNLKGRLAQGKADRVARYLPLGVSVQARDYVRDAIRGGRVRNVAFTAKGDLAQFPFRQAKSGEFRITGLVEDVALAYVPASLAAAASDTHAAAAPPPHTETAASPPPDTKTPASPPSHTKTPAWPPFSQVSGELVFERAALNLRQMRAQLEGLQLDPVEGTIADLYRDPTLQIRGRVQGPLADGLRYVKASPVSAMVRHALDDASATGPLALDLALTIPLHDSRATRVKGSVTLAGNDVRLTASSPLLAAARGRVDFDEHGFTLAGVHARIFGGEATAEGGSRPDGSVRVAGRGTISADGLRSARELPDLQRLAQAVQGQTPYTLQLGFAGGAPEILFTSSLQGMAIDLPEPLRKPADAAWPMRFATGSFAQAPAGGAAATAGAGAGASTDVLRFELGNVVQAVYQRDLSGPTPRVLRGAVAVRDSLPEWQPGVAAQVKLDRLDLDAWAALAKALPASTAAPEPAAAAPSGETDAAGGGYAPTRVTLQAREALAASRRFDNVSAEIQHAPAEAAWKARVRADQLDGRIEYHRPRHAGAGSARLVADLQRLMLPEIQAAPAPSAASSAASATPPSAPPAGNTAEATDPPALDVVIRDFALGSKSLGRVELQAASRPVSGADGKPAGREWTISRLTAAVAEAQLEASGRWAASSPGAAPRMAMNFKLALADSGALLERLGLGRVLRGGKGNLEGEIGWAGSPFKFDTPSLSGQIQLSLDAGQFLKADPGASRLLGVLSLQSLPRRLSLDFRDLFDKGFAFDNASGNVAIERGVARTNNLRMRGASAAVLMEGSADVPHETQDLRVIVVPQLDAGTAALAYAAINPAIGLGAFVAQYFLRKPLMQASTREFRVMGSWADPKVERVERKIGEPVPDMEGPAAAAAPKPPPNPNP
jgi:uncharacterized protein (TIGR02099 family)